jgi:hypothetical protein
MTEICGLRLFTKKQTEVNRLQTDKRTKRSQWTKRTCLSMHLSNLIIIKCALSTAIPLYVGTAT